MTYRTPALQRWYVCPRCGAPEQAPLAGGQVACSRCQAPHALPDRRALAVRPNALEPPADDPSRMQHLRMQDGRPRQVPPTLQAVLGGTNVQPGREQEAFAIWQSLRGRAAQGDVAASEDLSVLTLILGQHPAWSQPPIPEALSESACDAGVLPRHRQEQIGRLARMALGQGDRARALEYMQWLASGGAELEVDSEARVTAAALATLDRDGRRVLALLGPQKDAIPIADSMDALASVFRANAYELSGDVPTATRILRELPDQRMLAMVTTQFPALGLCAQSGHAYSALATQESAQRAAASASNVSTMLGFGLGVFGGVIQIVIGIASRSMVNLALGGVFAVVGAAVFFRGRAKGQRAAWLRTHGLSLPARIASGQPTGTRINNVPMYRFSLQVAGPQGPYAASLEKVITEHEVALLIGREVRIRANPENLAELILEE